MFIVVPIIFRLIELAALLDSRLRGNDGRNKPPRLGVASIKPVVNWIDYNTRIFDAEDG